jgi:hypothetical protein
VDNGFQAASRRVARIRDVSLLPGETLDYVFSPSLGFTDQPPDNGQLLIATSERIVAFLENDGRNETFLAPVRELDGVVVGSRSRSASSMVQGLLLTLAAIVIYVVVAYWFTGRIGGPRVPVVNMDLAPLIILLLALLAVGLVVKHYFSKQYGSVTFQGSNWSFTFPYQGNRRHREIHQLVDGVFAARQSGNSRVFLWED